MRVKFIAVKLPVITLTINKKNNVIYLTELILCLSYAQTLVIITIPPNYKKL